MRLRCKVESESKDERQSLVERLKQFADCVDVGNAVYASYCGADRRLADSIIAVVEQHRKHEISLNN